jgi:hypothetical protein
MAEAEQVILGIKEAAEVTPWSESTLYKAAKRGEAPFSKVQGRWVTTPEALKEWVREAPDKPKSVFEQEIASYERKA